MMEWLPRLGLDIEEIGPDYVKVEYNPNRPDFSSYAGIARAIQGIIELKLGLPRYKVKRGNVTINVDSSVAGVRPFIVGAVVRGLKLDQDAVKELMDMQEDLHWAIGRNRRKASIGIHNLDKVKPPFSYTTRDASFRFIPLDKNVDMSIKEILEKHEKGREFRHLVENTARYPIIVDRFDQVLSFPPIINGNLTRITEDTRNIFIDVTGPEVTAITHSLNILVTTLADMGGTIESVTLKYPDHTEITPNLEPRRMELKLNHASKLVGLKFSEKEAAHCLQKARLGVKKTGRNRFEIIVPAYRVDVMHEVDLIEDLVIGYGYYRLEPKVPSTMTIGQPHAIEKIAETVRQLMIGFGFNEVVNFILTNEETHYRKMLVEEGEHVKLANPISLEYTMIRESLLPGLMKNLMDNRHESFPQKIFEIFDVVKVDETAETKTRRELHVGGVSSHPTACYTEIKSVTEALLTNLGVTKWRICETSHPSFIPGRVAAIYYEDQEVGKLGEIHPEVLNNFELENPVVAFEINLDGIFGTKT
jgi:phenylalanyl-tRNA synthetase beta chain